MDVFLNLMVKAAMLRKAAEPELRPGEAFWDRPAAPSAAGTPPPWTPSDDRIGVPYQGSKPLALPQQSKALVPSGPLRSLPANGPKPFDASTWRMRRPPTPPAIPRASMLTRNPRLMLLAVLGLGTGVGAGLTGRSSPQEPAAALQPPEPPQMSPQPPAVPQQTARDKINMRLKATANSLLSRLRERHRTPYEG